MSCDTFVISRRISDMITANEKYQAKWTAAKMFIIKCFHLTLQIPKSCCEAVPDGKFEVQNYPTCTNIGFSISALSRKDRTWRKGTMKFWWSHLDVDILLCLASCCAEQPPVSMGGSVPRYRARKNGCCIARKQESIFKS